MKIPRTGAALLLLGLLACPARPPEAPGDAEDAPNQQGQIGEVGKSPHPDDDPLPAPEEIPSFLTQRLPQRKAGEDEALAPEAPGAHDPVERDAIDSELGFLSVWPVESRDPANPLTDEAPASAEVEGSAGHDAVAVDGDGKDFEVSLLSVHPGESRDPADPLPEAKESVDRAPCQDLREAIERHQDYLNRTHDERRAFGWVEDHEDGAALRLLESLRRCEAHPDDPDCRPPPLVADLADRTLESHEYSRDPSDVNADRREPDEIPHDPRMLDLLEKLRRCEAAKPLRAPDPLPDP